jgi:hypothetical protein
LYFTLLTLVQQLRKKPSTTLDFTFKNVNISLEEEDAKILFEEWLRDSKVVLYKRKIQEL